jgi:hypothetical protein
MHGMSVDVTDTVIQPKASFRQQSPVLDFLWYPSASLHNQASYCFVASVRECPVRLFEASTGRVSSWPTQERACLMFSPFIISCVRHTRLLIIANDKSLHIAWHSIQPLAGAYVQQGGHLAFYISQAILRVRKRYRSLWRSESGRGYPVGHYTVEEEQRWAQRYSSCPIILLNHFS